LVVMQWPSTAALQLNGDIPSKVSSLLAPRLTLPVQTSSKRWLCRRPIASTTWQSPAAAHLFTCQANLHLLERVEKSEEADEAARDGKVRALVAPLRSKVLG